MQFRYACLLIVIITTFCQVRSQSIGQNLDFENTTCSSTAYCYAQQYASGWTVNSGNPELINKNSYCTIGNWSIQLSGSEEIQQYLNTQPGTTYTLSLRANPSPYGSLDVTVGTNVTDFFYSTVPGCVWNSSSLAFVASSTRTLLKLRASGVIVDNITITAWPYPAANCYAPCSSNADCSNRGICTNVQNNSTAPKYCACYAGFSGCQCERKPALGCSSSYQDVTAHSLGFETSASLKYQYPYLYVNATANLEKIPVIPDGVQTNSVPYSTYTVAYFGGNITAYPNCSYPNTALWQKFPLFTCQDQYMLNISWTEALNSCGFYALPGTKTYTQTLTIQRYYNMTTSGLGRTEKHTRNLTVIFPQEIDLRTVYLTLSGIPNFQAVVTFLNYDPSTELWTVIVVTTLQSPYMIQNHAVANITSDLLYYNRFLNSQMETVSGCSTGSQICTQQITYQFGKGTAAASCAALTGSLKTNLTLTCDDSIPVGTCDLTPSQTIANFTMQFDTTSSCPTTTTIQFSSSSLLSFSDAQLSTPKFSFFYNEVAYFGILLQSTQAVITSKQIKPGSVCFELANGTCIPANYALLSAVGNYDPVFSVTFDSPANSGIFDPIASTSYRVKVTVTVSFLGAKSLKEGNPSNVNEDLTLDLYVQQAPVSPSSTPAVEMESDSARSSLVTMNAVLVMLCLVFMWM